MSIATVCAPSETSSSPREASQFLRTLHRELSRVVVPEMELTMRVAVLSAAGHTRQQIVVALDSSDIEVRMALVRLQRIARHW